MGLVLQLLFKYNLLLKALIRNFWLLADFECLNILDKIIVTQLIELLEILLSTNCRNTQQLTSAINQKTYFTAESSLL